MNAEREYEQQKLHHEKCSRKVASIIKTPAGNLRETHNNDARKSKHSRQASRAILHLCNWSFVIFISTTETAKPKNVNKWFYRAISETRSPQVNLILHFLGERIVESAEKCVCVEFILLTMQFQIVNYGRDKENDRNQPWERLSCNDTWHLLIVIGEISA